MVRIADRDLLFLEWFIHTGLHGIGELALLRKRARLGVVAGHLRGVVLGRRVHLIVRNQRWLGEGWRSEAGLDILKAGWWNEIFALTLSNVLRHDGVQDVLEDVFVFGQLGLGLGLLLVRSDVDQRRHAHLRDRTMWKRWGRGLGSPERDTALRVANLLGVDVAMQSMVRSSARDGSLGRGCELHTTQCRLLGRGREERRHGTCGIRSCTLARARIDHHTSGRRLVLNCSGSRRRANAHTVDISFGIGPDVGILCGALQHMGFGRTEARLDIDLLAQDRVAAVFVFVDEDTLYDGCAGSSIRLNCERDITESTRMSAAGFQHDTRLGHTSKLRELLRQDHRIAIQRQSSHKNTSGIDLGLLSTQLNLRTWLARLPEFIRTHGRGTRNLKPAGRRRLIWRVQTRAKRERGVGNETIFLEILAEFGRPIGRVVGRAIRLDRKWSSGG